MGKALLGSGAFRAAQENPAAAFATTAASYAGGAALRSGYRMAQRVGRKRPTVDHTLSQLGAQDMAKRARTAPKGRRRVRARSGDPEKGGLITSGKPVKLGKRNTVKLRVHNHGTGDAIDKLWIGSSTLGVQPNVLKTISLAIINHYLPKLGDIRANLQIGSGGGPADTWTSFRVVFDREPGFPGNQESATPGEYFSGSIVNGTIAEMLETLRIQLMNAAIRGFYPTEIEFVKNDWTSPTAEAPRMVLRDKLFGKTIVNYQTKGRYRFNNITTAGDGTGTNTDKHAIDANPVSGKIFNFRHQRPIFDPHYAEGLSDTQTLQGFKILGNFADEAEVIGGNPAPQTTDPPQYNSASAFVHLTAPPLRPRSVFKNCSKSGNVSIGPGAFKTYYTTFRRSTTLYKFMRDLVRVTYNQPGQVYNATAALPPMGDSFMMCLRPTIKSAANEKVTIAYDYEYVHSCSLSHAKRPPLPTFDLIE